MPGAPRQVFLLALGVYLLTMGGHTSSPDEETLFHQAEALVRERRVSLPAEAAATSSWLVPAPGGRGYSPYGLVQPLLFTPASVAAWPIAHYAPPSRRPFVRRMVVNLVDPFLTALTAALLVVAVTDLGYPRRVAIALALAFAFATIAWPYSKYLWSEPASALFLLAAWLAVRRAVSGERGFGLVAGAALGLAIGVKVTNAIALPGFLVYAAWPRREPWRRAGERLALVTAIPLAGAALLLALNWRRFGDPFETGYQALHVDFGNFSWMGGHGLRGLLVSPGKSIVVYSPPLVLALLAWPAFLRRHRREALLLLYLFLVNLLFFGTFWNWSGDSSWGPRYLVPLTPLLLLPAVAWLTADAGAVRRLLFAALCTAGFAIQLPGVLVNYAAYTIRSGEHAGYEAERRRFEVAASPPVGHVRLLAAHVARWLAPRPEVTLESGFHPPEPRAKGIFPRWSAGIAEARVKAGATTAHLTLDYCDYRPPDLPPAPIAFRVDGVAVTPLDRAREVNWCRRVELDLPPGEHRFAFEREPWNPERDTGMPDTRDLGVLIEDLRVESDGGTLTRGERLIPPLPVSEAAPWGPEAMAWFYRPPHLVDAWPWYLYHSGLDRRLVALAGLPLILVAAALRSLRSLSRAPGD